MPCGTERRGSVAHTGSGRVLGRAEGVFRLGLGPAASPEPGVLGMGQMLEVT